MIMVGTAKGGTGKSTVASLTALNLKERGYSVCVADMDISGPSIPKIMGVCMNMDGDPRYGIIPSVTTDGIPVISIDLLLNNKNTAILWKGDKKSDYIKSVLRDANWGSKPIDFMIVDLPPGNSNEPQAVIEFAKENKIPHGIVFVSTPQDVAVHDILKSVNMARKLKVPIIGIVENMSSFICGVCNTEHRIFGNGNVTTTCTSEKLPYLGRIPLVTELSVTSDKCLSLKTMPIIIKEHVKPITQSILKAYGV